MCGTDSIVKVPGCAGCCLCWLNVFFPGAGTMLSSCMGRDGFVGIQFLIGFCQFLLAATLIGWIWSIYWGCLIWSNADTQKNDVYTRA